MIRVMLFDLSEVVIAGLVGIEKPLAPLLGVPEERILPAFGGGLLAGLCRGKLSEYRYLELVICRQDWKIAPEVVKQIIRRNFHTVVPGMWELLGSLSARYELALLSDHAREWVAYIQGVHPELAVFRRQFYSFESGLLKSEPAAFQRALDALGSRAEECLFVDDNPANVATAQRAGLPAIRFTDASALASALAEQKLLSTLH